jgi:hypothetical protein
MMFLRKTALGACVTLFAAALFWFGLLWSLHQVIGTPTPIKQALKSSGIYQSIVGNALDQAQKDQQQQGSSGSETQIPVSDPQVRKIIGDAFPPSFLQKETESVIDSFYTWVNGKTPTLQFHLDLTEAKTRLANGVQQYAQAHLNSLPPCPANNIPSDVDPFSATCVPKGVDTAAIAAKARDQIIGGDFLKDPNFSADTIKTNNGKTLQQQVNKVPVAYKRGVQTMYGFGILAVLFGVAVVFLSAYRRGGIRKVAITAIVVGAVSAALAWAVGVVFHAASARLAAQNHTTSQPLQRQATDLVETLIRDMRNQWVIYGLVLVAAGIITLVVLKLTLPKATEAPGVPLEHPEGSLPNTPAAPAEQTNVPAKSAGKSKTKKPINI